MDFKLNFSALSATQLQHEKITVQEVTEVFLGDVNNTVWDSLSQYDDFGAYYYLIGFGFTGRFIQLVIGCNGDEIFFLDAKAASLEEIRRDFFKLP